MRIDRLAVGSAAPAVLVLVLSSATVHAQSPIVTVSAGPAAVKNLSAGDLAWQFGGGAERPAGPLALEARSILSTFRRGHERSRQAEALHALPPRAYRRLRSRARTIFGSTAVCDRSYLAA